MFFLWKRRGRKIQKKASQSYAQAEAACKDNLLEDNDLNEQMAFHISRHLGETVTIFVSGGGASGSGFTGLLLAATPSYVKLLIHPAPHYQCASWNIFCPKDAGFCVTGESQTGCFAYIPINKITSFVHNTL